MYLGTVLSDFMTEFPPKITKPGRIDKLLTEWSGEGILLPEFLMGRKPSASPYGSVILPCVKPAGLEIRATGGGSLLAPHCLTFCRINTALTLFRVQSSYCTAKAT